ncbi:hypothetical protein FD755_022845 [Muntiacus reevesi]|uniref:Secreted protein n=1 Tax=Muntiacus reevesi TaxID=9886 RepID=A0A5N3VY57_MUNRE|nr:hypothetical protein FD755_022845 [Muntiacus reevesi]
MQTPGALLIPPALICSFCLSASFLRKPEGARRESQTSAISRNIDTEAKFVGAGAATVGVAGSGASIGTESVPEAATLPRAILGFAVSEARRLFCPMAPFLIFFTV